MQKEIDRSCVYKKQAGEASKQKSVSYLDVLSVEWQIASKYLIDIVSDQTCLGNRSWRVWFLWHDISRVFLILFKSPTLQRTSPTNYSNFSYIHYFSLKGIMFKKACPLHFQNLKNYRKKSYHFSMWSIASKTVHVSR